MQAVRSERGRIFGQTTDPVNDIRHSQDWPGPRVNASGGPRLGKEQIMDSRDARLLEQYTSLEYILLGDLRDILEESLDRESRRWLIAVLDALLETLPREFDLEEHDGYMAEILYSYAN